MKYWEVIADNLKESRMELGLRLSDCFQRMNDLGCWRTSWRRKAFRCARGWIADSVSGTRIDDSCGRTPRGLRSARNKARQIVAILIKTFSITSSDVSTYLRRGWIGRRGWTFAETPPNAISRSNWSPESAELRPLCKASLEEGSWFRTELDCS